MVEAVVDSEELGGSERALVAWHVRGEDSGLVNGSTVATLEGLMMGGEEFSIQRALYSILCESDISNPITVEELDIFFLYGDVFDFVNDFYIVNRKEGAWFDQEALRVLLTSEDEEWRRLGERQVWQDADFGWRLEFLDDADLFVAIENVRGKKARAEAVVVEIERRGWMLTVADLIPLWVGLDRCPAWRVVLEHCYDIALFAYARGDIVLLDGIVGSARCLPNEEELDEFLAERVAGMPGHVLGQGANDMMLACWGEERVRTLVLESPGFAAGTLAGDEKECQALFERICSEAGVPIDVVLDLLDAKKSLREAIEVCQALARGDDIWSTSVAGVRAQRKHD